MSAPIPRRHRWRLRRWLVVLLLLLVVLAAVQLVLAARAATSGRQALEAAAQAGRDRDLATTERELLRAQRDLRSARGHLDGAGPVIWLARRTPLVRIQVRAGEAVLEAGDAAATAGVRALPAVRAGMPGGVSEADVPALVAALAEAAPELRVAIEQLVSAQERVAVYDRYRLLGPLESAYQQVNRRLTEAADRAVRSERALTVALDLAGAEAPRRFLLLSQNPDEPRPTGGYMGTYGVLSSDAGRLDLERYAAMGDWHTANPEAAVPASQTPFPFRYTSEPQSLGNVNTSPDWPTSAQLARKVWLAGGEEDVDGVVTYLPGFIARLLAATGPVEVPGYGETVTAENLDARLEHYTHSEATRGLPSGVRKAFIGALGEAVLERVLTLPAERLPDLAASLDAAMAAGELAIWSTRAPVQEALGQLEWDGAFRGWPGDVFVDAEFAFAAENGRGIRRTFDHEVDLRPDGSGRSATTMTIRNTQPFEPGYNPGTHAYLTPYGPRGAVLADGSDPPAADEPSLAGHPTAGFLRDAPPLGEATLRVVWEAPELAAPAGDGTWEYRLTWRPTPGHLGDELRLRVQLPAGWTWSGPPPPAVIPLRSVYFGAWKINAA